MNGSVNNPDYEDFINNNIIKEIFDDFISEYSNNHCSKIM